MDQVMYATLFVITQDPFGNTYLVTKLLTLRLGFTFFPFSINITLPFTPATLSTQRTVIENVDSLQFFHGRVYLCYQEPLAHPHYKGRRFHPNSIKTNEKNK